MIISPLTVLHNFNNFLPCRVEWIFKANFGKHANSPSEVPIHLPPGGDELEALATSCLDLKADRGVVGRVFLAILEYFSCSANQTLNKILGSVFIITL